MGKVTSKKLLQNAVSGVDPFSALRYSRLREQTPNVLRAEEKGAETLPNISSALLDLYHSLWAIEPTVKSVEETPTSLRYWRQLYESALNTSAYQQMHARTQLQEMLSIVGTLAMNESVLGMIPDKDKDNLQQQAQVQAQADQAQQEMQDAQGQADGMQQVVDQLQQAMNDGQPSDQNQDGEGQPADSQNQSQQAMRQAQSQMQRAQEQAQSAQMTFEQAQQRLQELNQELMGEAGSEQALQKQQELERIGLQAAKDAAEQVKEVSDLLQSWGTDAGELQQMDSQKALSIVERMKQNESFKRFKELLGKMRAISARKSRSNQRKNGKKTKRVVYSDDITRAETDFLVQLTNPYLRHEALQQWMQGTIPSTEEEIKQVLGKGPVVVCEDGSGSMSGEKKDWAKAVTLALAYYAKLERRDFVWIHFGSKDSRMVVRIYKKGQMTLEQMLEIAETFLSSGTDFEKPLDEALRIIEEEKLLEADIAMLTDGECAVSDEWLAEFLKKKKVMEVSVFTVLMDVDSSSSATVETFSDQVETVSNYTAETAGQQVIAHLR